MNIIISSFLEFCANILQINLFKNFNLLKNLLNFACYICYMIPENMTQLGPSSLKQNSVILFISVLIYTIKCITNARWDGRLTCGGSAQLPIVELVTCVTVES